jgi:hypothetical protein
MQWLADARLVVGYAPSRTGPTAAAALGLVRKESRVLDVPVAAHLPVAPEMDPGSSERRFVRGIEALTAMVEAGEALLPPALQQEFLDCFAFCDWSRVRVCVCDRRCTPPFVGLLLCFVVLASEVEGWHM